MTNNSDDPFEKIGSEYLFQDAEAAGAPKPPGKKVKKPRKKSGRNFWIAAGVLAVLFILLAGSLTLLSLYVLPRIKAANLEQAALINARNTATVAAATNAALQAAQADTATPAPTHTSAPTFTPVIVLPSSTPTAAATQAGIGGQVGNSPTPEAEMTATPVPTSTALPDTGLAEDIGIPGLFGIALLLVLLIFLTRRIRQTG
jgi:LPXTG-motif cell wall-anchored protein